jgi:hypothetical protein
MAQSILMFDFGTNEEAAQQARHKIEGWQQGSRLGKKILFKFNREESGSVSESEAAPSTDESGSKGKTNKKKPAQASNGDTAKGDGPGSDSCVCLLIRLDFSDHEKLTQQRWLDRIAAEEPFKSAKGETIRHGNAAFAETAELFDSLD